MGRYTGLILWTGLVPYPNEFCSLSSVRRKLHACWLCKLGWKFFEISKVFVGLGHHLLGSQSLVESWNSIRFHIPVNLWAFSFIGPGVNRDIASVLLHQFARRRLEGEISQMCCIEIFAIEDGFYMIHHVTSELLVLRWSIRISPYNTCILMINICIHFCGNIKDLVYFSNENYG